MTAVAAHPRNPTAAEVAREIEVRRLVVIIRALEAELAEARRVRSPVIGGPPPEWDADVLALDDATFAGLVGSKDREVRLPPSLHTDLATGYVAARSHPSPAATPAHPWAGLKPVRAVALGLR